MAVEAAVLVNRLIKINKNDLIDILVYRRLPENLSECENLQYIKTNYCEKCRKHEENEEEKVFDANEVKVTCTSTECKLRNCEYKFIKKELDSKDKLISHLEGRISDQQDIIKIFKCGNESTKNTATFAKISKSTPSNSKTQKQDVISKIDSDLSGSSLPKNKLSLRKSATQEPNTREHQQVNQDKSQMYNPIQVSEIADSIAKIQKEMLGDKNDEDFNEVKYKKRRPKVNVVVGNNSTTTCSLKPSNALAFLHVYKLHPETNVEELTSYLSQLFPEVKCEKLNSQYPNYYSSFKVTIHKDHYAQATDPALWPKGSCVNRFFHRRKTPNSSS